MLINLISKCLSKLGYVVTDKKTYDLIKKDQKTLRNIERCTCGHFEVRLDSTISTPPSWTVFHCLGQVDIRVKSFEIDGHSWYAKMLADELCEKLNES